MPDPVLPLSKPDLTRLEEDLVLGVLRSGRLSMGPVVEEFERLVAARAGRRYGVACNSGTSGLHLVCRSLGLGPGDEVITTPFSFVASANCILMVGAQPVFVDVCPRSLNMDPAAVEKAITPRTRAILAVETFGSPTYMDQYALIAAKREIPLIEDCCEALGTVYRGRPCGSFGRIGVFGFYPNKQITTGEGGMIVTDDERLAELCRSMRNQGRPIAGKVDHLGRGGVPLGSWLKHERLGYNYRLADVNAAIGVGQMQRLDSMLARRREVAQLYMAALADNTHIIMPTIEPETLMSWFIFVVRLATTYTLEERDRIIDGLRRHQIGCADYFPCIHMQAFYRELGYKPGSFPIAESVAQRTIALPFFNDMARSDVDYVVRTLDVMLKRENLSRR
ncbi:MAG: DegT/DnrJ/EryC1/StrS family aminotransferase [Planctomycetota bacterium]|nr:DegT/DnrJ/EryC1/StrS family aminotransferase [Planctomycetota bacterium]